MADDGKLLLSKDCVGAFVAELGEKDRFEVMTFNVTPALAFNAAKPADAQHKHEALAWLAQARAAGGTVLQPALATAYKYADPDRPLNVIILSDGLTEQRDRQTLLSLIKQRPANAKVFCIGVGNDVNRPLLEQLAEDSGGLAAFTSRGDDFARQAKAFRRKLLRPAASALEIDFGGVETYDVEPRQLPNLYHGAPVRLYGRYRGSGTAQVRLRASINGVAWEQSSELEFPKEDAANPEIERMWAWKRIDGLLKDADRTGSRERIVPEIVRLGEGFSIVTEYTSFLVLENDAEYQRWKIARTNAARVTRDRAAQNARVQEEERIRAKAVADLGPQPAAQARAPALAANVPQPVPNALPNSGQPASPATAPNQSRDVKMPSFGGGGGGPVGPLFVLFSALLGWRKRRMA
jgi:Ca-activated chloride channel family protein